MEGKLFQIEKGIYSEKEYVSELQVIIFKYPIAIIQTPKPDLIPRLYLHRLLRLHTQPVLVGAVHGIHICQKHFVRQQRLRA